MKIIDAHVHIVQYISGFTSRGELRAIGNGRAAYADGSNFQMFPADMGDIGVSAEKILDVMDKNGVEKAVLLQGQFYGFQNEYTAAAIKKYPERFTGAASYDPFCVKADEIKRHLFGELGFKAVKFEMSNGSGLMAYHKPINLNGEIMRGCYSHARENNLTVVLDIGRPRNCCWQVDELASAIRDFPEVTFVICHLLAPQRTDIELLKSALGKLTMQNVYFDLSSLAHNQQPEKYPYPTAVQHFKTAKSVIGADRLMFGSDIPSNLVHDSYEHLLNYITESGVFTETELNNILHDTADRVYFGNQV